MLIDKNPLAQFVKSAEEPTSGTTAPPLATRMWARLRMKEQQRQDQYAAMAKDLYLQAHGLSPAEQPAATAVPAPQTASSPAATAVPAPQQTQSSPVLDRILRRGPTAALIAAGVMAPGAVVGGLTAPKGYAAEGTLRGAARGSAMTGGGLLGAMGGGALGAAALQGAAPWVQAAAGLGGAGLGALTGGYLGDSMARGVLGTPSWENKKEKRSSVHPCAVALRAKSAAPTISGRLARVFKEQPTHDMAHNLPLAAAKELHNAIRANPEKYLGNTFWEDLTGSYIPQADPNWRETLATSKDRRKAERGALAHVYGATPFNREEENDAVGVLPELDPHFGRWLNATTTDKPELMHALLTAGNKPSLVQQHKNFAITPHELNRMTDMSRRGREVAIDTGPTDDLAERFAKTAASEPWIRDTATALRFDPKYGPDYLPALAESAKELDASGTSPKERDDVLDIMMPTVRTDMWRPSWSGPSGDGVLLGNTQLRDDWVRLNDATPAIRAEALEDTPWGSVMRSLIKKDKPNEHLPKRRSPLVGGLTGGLAGGLTLGLGAGALAGGLSGNSSLGVNVGLPVGVLGALLGAVGGAKRTHDANQNVYLQQHLRDRVLHDLKTMTPQEVRAKYFNPDQLTPDPNNAPTFDEMKAYYAKNR